MKTQKQIPLKKTLFFFSLTALKGDKFKINKMAAALIPEYNFGTGQMYQWPFPNSSLTYSPGFCWGSDAIAKRMYEGEGATLEQLPILYQRFFEKYVPYLKEDGFVLVDNLDFHGMIFDIPNIKNRNTRALVRKIKRFKDWIFSNEE